MIQALIGLPLNVGACVGREGAAGNVERIILWSDWH